MRATRVGNKVFALMNLFISSRDFSDQNTRRHIILGKIILLRNIISKDDNIAANLGFAIDRLLSKIV